MPLSANQLARLRARTVAEFPDTALVQRRDPAGDGQGGQSESWEEVDSYPCRLIRRTVATASEGEQPVAVYAWAVLLPHDADVQFRDRLTINTLTYDVLDADRGQSERLCLSVAVSRSA